MRPILPPLPPRLVHPRSHFPSELDEMETPQWHPHPSQVQAEAEQVQVQPAQAQYRQMRVRAAVQARAPDAAAWRSANDGVNDGSVSVEVLFDDRPPDENAGRLRRSFLTPSMMI